MQTARDVAYVDLTAIPATKQSSQSNTVSIIDFRLSSERVLIADHNKLNLSNATNLCFGCFNKPS